jgi:hypothetical protein
VSSFSYLEKNTTSVNTCSAGAQMVLLLHMTSCIIHESVCTDTWGNIAESILKHSARWFILTLKIKNTDDQSQKHSNKDEYNWPLSSLALYLPRMTEKHRPNLWKPQLVIQTPGPVSM